MVKLEKLIRRRKLKVILFADISGSSALYKNQGNIAAKRIVDSLLDAMQRLIIDAKGNVIKTIGDEVMASFQNGDNVLKAAISIQKRFTPLLKKHELQMSIGVGAGEVLSDNGDLFGEAVNDAAHLTQLAKGGQILLTESVWSLLSPEFQATVREYDRIKFKGADVTSIIYRVYWQEGDPQLSETRMMSGKLVNDQLNTSLLKVKYQGCINTISQNQTPFIIGRDVNKCDLLIQSSQVSREHCQIDFRRGKFVLIDHSTNGCFLSPVGKEEFYIRREEYPLLEPIELSLGIPTEQASGDTIHLY